MNAQQMAHEIQELNLSYLVLAQSMARADHAEACFRLGISEQAAERIAGLTLSQIARIAATGQLLCRARFEDGMVWDLLASHAESRTAAGIHAAILMAGELAEAA